MMQIFILLLLFGSIFILAFFIFPVVSDGVVKYNQKRSKQLADQMDRMFIRTPFQTIFLIYTFAPVLFALVGFLLFPNELKFFGIILGIVVGLVGPSIYVQMLRAQRQQKFYDNLIDALMVLSSSLKGGLSLVQAMEVVVEEIPYPTNQEIGIVLGENKMGVSLEDALKHLYERMPSNALEQIITAILLARETGGNLPVIFQKIINTIRENKKIQQNLQNLTLQGKLQGGIMSLLPFGFAAIVLTTNPGFFNNMLKQDIGKGLIIYCICSELLGLFFIWRISSFKDF